MNDDQQNKSLPNSDLPPVISTDVPPPTPVSGVTSMQTESPAPAPPPPAYPKPDAGNNENNPPLNISSDYTQGSGNKPKGKIIAAIAALVLLLAGIGAGIFLLNRNLDIREKAANGVSDFNHCAAFDGYRRTADDEVTNIVCEGWNKDKTDCASDQINPYYFNICRNTGANTSDEKHCANFDGKRQIQGKTTNISCTDWDKNDKRCEADQENPYYFASCTTVTSPTPTPSPASGGGGGGESSQTPSATISSITPANPTANNDIVVNFTVGGNTNFVNLWVGVVGQITGAKDTWGSDVQQVETSSPAGTVYHLTLSKNHPSRTTVKTGTQVVGVLPYHCVRKAGSGEWDCNSKGSPVSQTITIGSGGTLGDTRCTELQVLRGGTVITGAHIEPGETITFRAYCYSAENEIYDKFRFTIAKYTGITVQNDATATRAPEKDAGDKKFYTASQTFTVEAAQYTVKVWGHTASKGWKGK